MAGTGAFPSSRRAILEEGREREKEKESEHPIPHFSAPSSLPGEEGGGGGATTSVALLREASGRRTKITTKICFATLEKEQSREKDR